MTTTPYQDGFKAGYKAGYDAAEYNRFFGDAETRRDTFAVPPEPSPWRPMEEASKDNAVLVWCKFEGFKGQCWWDETTSNWRDIVGNGVRKPTHFMLPPPGPEGE